jgi:hypothetical protein
MLPSGPSLSGCRFDGVALRGGSELQRIGVLTRAFQWLADGVRVSGRRIEVLLGHFAVESHHHGPVPSVPRAFYAFRRFDCDRALLWDSAACRAFVVVAIRIVWVGLFEVWFSLVRTCGCDRCVDLVGGCAGVCRPGPEVACERDRWAECWFFQRVQAAAPGVGSSQVRRCGFPRLDVLTGPAASVTPPLCGE